MEIEAKEIIVRAPYHLGVLQYLKGTHADWYRWASHWKGYLCGIGPTSIVGRCMRPLLMHKPEN